ncbi:hypothetical protein [Paenibacillus sp. HB172176]|uniref:SF0329 family protein n=1 Tax=Paenibacillus sp. HB172176 TaxID=2493690 RepID=UPI0014391BF6|nr:hypothetical protein [Paenibacillus sp. HB172176]
MAWSKLKQNLESFLYPGLIGKVEYGSTSYRYLPGKAGQCYLTVDKRKILNMNDASNIIKWYQSEQDIKNDPAIRIGIGNEDIEAVRKEMKGPVPEERLRIIAESRKKAKLAKELMTAQAELCKSDFRTAATAFLSAPLEKSLESQDILLNILALIDKRMGRKRIINLAEKMKLKHPIVQYFYELRLSVL